MRDFFHSKNCSFGDMKNKIKNLRGLRNEEEF